jgi:hypothetical protein
MRQTIRTHGPTVDHPFDTLQVHLTNRKPALENSRIGVIRSIDSEEMLRG